MENFVLKFTDLIYKYPYLKTLCLTVLLIIFFGILRVFAFTIIAKKFNSKREELAFRKKASRYLLYSLLLMTFFLWFTQLQIFFVSILAVAAAIVVALKELIMCVTGGILANISNTFKVGDRIEIDSLRGFVIEKKLLTTKILEIGPERNSQQTTGDIISIPNSLMLSKSLKNESYFKGYSIKSFIFKLSSPDKVNSFEECVVNLAEDFCHSYIDEAKRSISKFCEKEGIVVPSINPKTKIIIEDGQDISVLVKLPVKNTQLADIEQLLNRFYVDWCISQKKGETL